MSVDPMRHWDAAYRSRGPAGVSWFQDEPTVSLELLAATPTTSVIDVGGGASILTERLLDRGVADLTVLDVSAEALASARQRLGERAERVAWVEHDLLAWRPERTYDAWHDRAVFHFLVDLEQRERYVATLVEATAAGSRVVVGTFAPDGPQTCSGLPVARYDPMELAAALGPKFTPVTERREVHRTPGGGEQPFTWLALRRTE